jgi:hypothetical protein
MINPNLIRAGYVKIRGSNYGIKEYRPAFSRYKQAFYAHRVFKRAEDAMNYANRTKDRWIRLYDAAILAKMGEQPI